MTTNLDSAFEAPKAELNDNSGDNPVLQFQRKSAWLVFFLGIITLGIYPIYWYYTRTPIASQISPNNKINMGLVHGYIGTYVLSIIVGFISDDTGIIGFASLAFSIAQFVLYIMLAFSWRSTLRDIINHNASMENYVNVNGILTFFFSVLYFQYKINQAIDNTSSTENQNEQVTAA